MKQHARPLCVVRLGIVLLLSSCCARLVAQEADPQPIQIQRITVPKEKIGEIGTKAIPIEREAWRRRIEELNEKYRAQKLPVGTKITQASYAARLEGDQLVDGSARLDFHHQPRSPARVEFGPLGLAANSFQWLGDPRVEAQIGLIPSGEQVIFVEQSGTLGFQWSLRSTSGETARPEFELSLPPAAASELEIELPSGWKPQCAEGLVSRVVNATLSEATSNEGLGTCTWRIELGAATQATLRVLPEVEADAANRVMLGSQEDRYRITTLGMEVRSHVSLDVHHAGLRQLEVEADAELQLVSAFAGSEAARVIAAPVDDASAARQYVIELPQTLLGAGRSVTLTAYAPMVTGSNWRLPSIRWSDVVWQQRLATLEIVEPLLLRQLRTNDASLDLLEPLPAPLSGELRQFRLLGPEPRLEVLLRHERPRVLARTGTTVSLGEPTMSAQFVAKLSSLGGDVFDLQFQRHSEWLLDSVETIPSDALLDVVPRGSGGLGRAVRLRRPITSDEAVTLVVKAHRSAPNPATLSGADLRAIRLVSIDTPQHVVAVSAEPPLQLSVTRDAGVSRLQTSSLAPSDVALLNGTDPDLLYMDSPEADVMRVLLRRAAPRLDSNITIDARVESESLKLAYLFRCVPISPRVSQVNVQFLEALGTTLHWDIVGEQATALSARRLGDEHAWEITLRRPRSVPFELRASCVLPLNGRTSIPLAAVPEAEAQKGSVILSAADGRGLSVQHHGLKVVTAPASDLGSRWSTRTVFQFAPARAAALSVARSNPVDEPKAWIWSAELSVQANTNGDLQHDLLLYVENAGARTCTVALPEGVELHEALVDDQTVRADPSTRSLIVPLPSQVRFAVIRLGYVAHMQSLGHLSRVAPRLVRLDIPCMHWTCNVWLPPGYAEASRQTSYRADSDVHWDQRLFGYEIVRRAGLPSNLLSAEFWRQIPRQLSREERAVLAAERFLTAAQPVLSVRERSLTWADVVNAYDVASAQDASFPQLWLDSAALGQVRISPDSKAFEQQGDPSSVSACLRSADLVLLVVGHRLLLTSHAAQASGTYGRCIALSDRVLLSDASVKDSELAARMVPVEHWLDQESRATRVWRSSVPGESAQPLVGWTLVKLPVAMDESASLLAYRVGTASAVSWAMFLIAVAAGIWTGQRNRRGLSFLILGAAAAALIVPAPVIGAARAVFLGALASTIFLLCGRSPSAARESADDSFSVRIESRALATMRVLLLALLLVPSLREAISQDAVALRQQPPDEEPYLLYDPVDQENAPSGPYVYVPKRLFDAVSGLESGLRPDPIDWLMESAHYSLELQAETPMDLVRLGQLTGDFEITTFVRDNVYVELPLRAADLQLLEAKLNGSRIYPQWSEESDRLGFFINRPGRHQLQLVLRPNVTINRGRRGFDIAIPKSPSADLDIESPGFVNVVPVSARGQVKLGDREVHAHLGAADRLAVQWDVAAPAAESHGEFSVAQLSWLRTTPQSALLDTQFSISVRRGQISHLDLLVDSRWRLLPFAANSPCVRFEVRQFNNALAAGPKQAVRLWLDRPYVASEKLTLTVSYLVNDLQDLQQVSLPYLADEPASDSKPLLAVSTSSTSAQADVSSDGLLEYNLNAFAAAWGTMQLPAQAYQLPAANSIWTLSLAPPKSQLNADEELYLAVGRDRADLSYYARIERTGTPVWQLELSTTAGMKLHNLSVIQDDADVVQRWADDDVGTTTVFLSRPITGTAHLSLSGTLPLPRRGEVLVQGLRLLSATGGSRLWQIYRKPEVLVQLEADETAPALPSSHLGSLGTRLLAAWSANSRVPRQVTLNVRPNPSRFTARLMTQLRQENAEWFVEADLNVTPIAGVLDAIRLRVPKSMAESLTLTPNTPFEIREIPGQTDVQLILRPPDVVAEETTWRLSAPWRALVPGSLAPDIEALDAIRAERFLTLPKYSGEQALVWDVQGLEEPREGPSHTTYRVRGSRMRAVVRVIEQPGATPRVLLADNYLVWNVDGTYSGIVEFDLNPGKFEECEVEVAPQVQLLHLAVAGTTAWHWKSGESTYNVKLGPEDLPQRLTVLFKGKAAAWSAGRRGFRFSVPSPRGFKVDKTLWTLRSATQIDPPTLLLEHTTTTAEVLRSLRIDHLKRILASTEGLLSPHQEEQDPTTWRAIWERRLHAAHALDDMGGVNSGELHVYEQGGISTVSRFQDVNDGPILHAWQQGAASDVSILVPDRHAIDLLGRLASVAGLVGVYGGGLLLVRSSRFTAWASRWPHLLGVACGLMWWIWLSPSFLGWVLVLVCLISTLRPPWHGKAVRLA